MIHPEGYTVRAWTTRATEDPVDSDTPFDDLGAAIDAARQLCEDRGKRYRSVMVTDPFGTLWAQFNFLWEAAERAEKLKAHHGAV